VTKLAAASLQITYIHHETPSVQESWKIASLFNFCQKHIFIP